MPNWDLFRSMMKKVGHGRHMIHDVLSKRLDDGTFVEDAKSPMKLLCLQYPCIVTSFSPSSGVASAVDLRVASAVDLSVATPPAATLKKAPNPGVRHWCRLPHSQFLDKKRQITAEDFSSTIAGLTLWNWLVPPSSDRLMSPDKHTIHGEVLFGRCMWEGKQVQWN